MGAIIATDDREMIHVPVLVNDVVRLVLHEHSRIVIDGTIGCGGHASALLEAHPRVRLIGIDTDEDSLAVARKTLAGFGERVSLLRASFADLPEILAPRFGVEKVDGILLDFGMSTYQLDQPSRGFSYAADGPLDMRMGGTGASAADLIVRASEEEIAGILRKYGEVAGAGRIARTIKEAARSGRMSTTFDLKRAVLAAVGRDAGPALLSKVFQAFRIAVNGELENIRRFLERVDAIVNRGGRLVFLSYHSLEDRAVKDFINRESRDCICPPETPVCRWGHRAWLRKLTPKPITPGREETAANPRSRSAKLRAAEVL